MAMKKITFNADEGQLDLAKGPSLEEEVHQWLKDFGEGSWKLLRKSRSLSKAANQPNDSVSSTHTV
jgi:hypothetical protein